MPRPTLTMRCAEPRSTVCAAAAERLAGFGANLRGVDCRREGRDCGWSEAARVGRVGAKRSRLHRDEARPVAAVTVAAVQPPLHELPGKYGAVFDRDHVADQHLAEAAGERRGVIAHLIGMRKDHLRGVLVLDELLQSEAKPVRGVRREQRMLDAQRLCQQAFDAASAASASVCAPITTAVMSCAGPSCSAAARASQLERLILPPRLFQNQKNAHSTRASVFSFSTSAAAASFGEPGRICVDFCFFGSRDLFEHDDGRRVRAELGGAHRAQFFRFGVLDAHQRGVAQLGAARLHGEHRGQRAFRSTGTILLPARASR